MRVLLTGAASGIGRATCLRLARDARARGQTAEIATVDVVPLRELDGLAAELRKLDAKALPLYGDMGDADAPGVAEGDRNRSLHGQRTLQDGNDTSSVTKNSSDTTRFEP